MENEGATMWSLMKLQSQMPKDFLKTSKTLSFSNRLTSFPMPKRGLPSQAFILHRFQSIANNSFTTDQQSKAEWAILTRWRTHKASLDLFQHFIHFRIKIRINLHKNSGEHLRLLMEGIFCSLIQVEAEMDKTFLLKGLLSKLSIKRVPNLC